MSYNPSNLTVSFETDTYVVRDGNNPILRASGQNGDSVGQQALALAQRYRKHCFLGRGNVRTDKNSYIFDYWRSPSGLTPTIPGQEDLCSTYDNHNLTAEDMGGGDGWRVKDHDHVLQLFDNGPDARSGKLVLTKYTQICFVGDSGVGDDPELVSYMVP